MSTVIQAEELGKSYNILHEQKQRYPTLRDTLVESVRNLGKPRNKTTKETFWALRDVSFEIEQGDRVAVVGRNGAGKSTLLKILSRITPPSTGRVSIRGRVASLLEIGTGFHPELTGRENIYLNGAILGMQRREIDRRFDEIVAFAEVERFLDTPVKRYSSGMYTRLAFAVAAHLDSDILIVDEVLSVGDASFQEKCLRKTQELGGQGRTIIFVSHNLSAVKSMCEKGILLAGGCIAQTGDVDLVVQSYSEMLVSAEEGAFSYWQTKSLDVLDLELCDLHGRRLSYIDTDTDIYVSILYCLKMKSRPGFVLTLSRDGQDICKSISNNDDSFHNVKEPGEYRSVCHIPSMLLNQGRFMLGLTVFQDNYLEPEELSNHIAFDVQDGPGVRRDYFGKIRGFIRPDFSWSTSSLVADRGSKGGHERS